MSADEGAGAAPAGDGAGPGDGDSADAAARAEPEPSARAVAPAGDLVWLWDPAAGRTVWTNAAAAQLGARRLAEFTRTLPLAPGSLGPAAIRGAEGPVFGALGCDRAALADGSAAWRLRLARNPPAPGAAAARAAAFDAAAAPLAVADLSGRVIAANRAFNARRGAQSFDPDALARGRIDGGAGDPALTARPAAEPGEGRAFWLIEAAPAGAGGVATTALSKIAHDLRSPLTAVLGFAEFLKIAAESMPPERMRSYLDDLCAAAERMRSLADAVVALGAAAEGAAGASLDAVTLDSARLAGPAAAARGAWIEAEAATGLGLDRDAGTLARAATNLIDNAIRHGGEGVRVRVEARDLGPGQGAALTVTDDGPGLDAAALAEARRPWGRPGPRAAGEPAGGLGLTLVEEIAAEWGGRLEIDTAPGRGFRATIRLPPERLVRTPEPVG